MTHRILIVDGSRTVRKMLEIKLKGRPYDIVFSAGSNQALAKLNRQRFSWVLTSRTLPDESGVDFIKALRKIAGCEDLPVALISSDKLALTDLDPLLRVAGFIDKSKGIDAVVEYIDTIMQQPSGLKTPVQEHAEQENNVLDS